MDFTAKYKINFSYCIAASVNLMSMLAGVGYAWSSPCIPKLAGQVGPEFNPLPKPANLQEISWITALHCMGAIFGPLLTGCIAYKIGKKKTLILFAIPQMVSHIILIFANKVVHFYVARFLLGMGTGCVFSLVPVYVAEISEASHRGRTSMFLPLMLTLTQDLMFVIGPYVTIRTLALWSLLPSILFFISFGIFMPESPYDCVKRNKISKAQHSLMFSRQTSNVQDELQNIINYIDEDKKKSRINELCKSRAVGKSFLVAFMLMFFQQFNGSNAIFAYQQTIFSASESTIPADKSVMLVGAFQILVQLFVSKLVDSWGRKNLLIVSYVCQLISLVSLGIYFCLQRHNFNIECLFWLPITSVMLFMLSFKMGAGPVSWIIAGEIFPTNFKFVLSPLIAFCMTFMSFLVTFVFPKFSVYIGYEYSFWIFGVVVATAIPYIYLMVPETSGKSLKEIESIFQDEVTTSIENQPYQKVKS
ncbi:facilitated trehalose transporter Tret1-2 homolog [Diabrotica virgifera virgifera]|uniref:Major facilitator superfamily (MFS) profile domain-containing protein n=1 Tax=Diabrotica virgifera virgifera TaxID=50390 RepID=A0ABM5IKB8_DIAVI|nr:facilitated trehalose transporter Tret1-2 homolog [Diabrotica virgifera virgifera]